LILLLLAGNHNSEYLTKSIGFIGACSESSHALDFFVVPQQPNLTPGQAESSVLSLLLNKIANIP
jgi:hypothetical protein